MLDNEKIRTVIIMFFYMLALFTTSAVFYPELYEKPLDVLAQEKTGQAEDFVNTENPEDVVKEEKGFWEGVWDSIVGAVTGVYDFLKIIYTGIAFIINILTFGIAVPSMPFWVAFVYNLFLLPCWIYLGLLLLPVVKSVLSAIGEIIPF